MMDKAAARKWLVISALVVAGVWGYRRTRQAANDPAEAGKTLLAFPEFITAWGAVYFTLALIAEAAPRFAGAMAILIMTGDALSQGQQVIADVQSQQAGGKTSTPATPASPAPASHVKTARSAQTITSPAGVSHRPT